MLDSKDFKETMYFIFVVLISMVLQPKLRHYNKIKLQNKFVISTIRFIKMSMTGLTLVLIILEGQVLNGIPKYAKKSFLIFKKMVGF
jgi:hypothetical protein